MGIVVERDPVGTQCNCLFERLAQGFGCLERQTEDEIEIQRTETQSP